MATVDSFCFEESGILEANCKARHFNFGLCDVVQSIASKNNMVAVLLEIQILPLCASDVSAEILALFLCVRDANTRFYVAFVVQQCKT